MNVHMLEFTQYAYFRSESEVSDTTAPRSQFSAAEYARQQGQHKAIIAKVRAPIVAPNAPMPARKSLTSWCSMLTAGGRCCVQRATPQESSSRHREATGRRSRTPPA